ncbi:MAG TPA: CehA/McbA family metallohydrolase, partial [Planctomycetota bacterium]|nr:CehA/McbA family metallohydrolase [Planctomycetota bacterium]
APLRWFKGNTHTHTLSSDGDSSAGEVTHWYRDHGYDFLCLSDHNYLTPVGDLQRELDRETLIPGAHPMLLIPAEEVTDGLPAEGASGTLHVNAFDLRGGAVAPQHGATVREVIQRDVDAIAAAGALPMLNHPNYGWNIAADDLAAVRGLRTIEIYNGHPGVHNLGDLAHPAVEALWDDLLTRGARVLGVAVDDTHDLRTWGPRACNPGRGWIVVRARELEAAQIRAAIERGDFYASTGVVLADVGRRAGGVFVKVAPEVDEGTRYTIDFVGPGGRVLETAPGVEADHAFAPGEDYVRVRVRSSLGERAWSQPFFLEAR